MAFDRGEGTGIAVALVGHVVLFGLLSVGFLDAPDPVALRAAPIEIMLTDEVGLESEAPVVSRELSAARLSEVEAPVEAEAPVPDPQPEPDPVAKPVPEKPAPSRAPSPKPEKAEKTPPKAAPAQRPKPSPKSRDVKPTGNLDGIVGGASNNKTDNKSNTPAAQRIGPQQRNALAALIRRQLKPKWRGQAPTGADADKLVTTVRVRLKPDGSLAAKPVVTEQRGVTPSNRAQKDLHAERAIRAVELAAPFDLPAEYYDAWKDFETDFDKGLSQ